MNATLPNNLREEFPGILDRLCRNGDTAWRETFLEAVSETDGKRKRQNVSGLVASPGNRQAMPTIAMGSVRTRSTSSRRARIRRRASSACFSEDRSLG